MVNLKDIVIHFAAKVGGIGANQENQGKFFYDNLMKIGIVSPDSRFEKRAIDRQRAGRVKREFRFFIP